MNKTKCESSICNDIEELLQVGWNTVTKSYAKEKNSTKSKYELHLLTGIRLYFVNKLFECAKKELNNTNDCSYFAFGSNNITSDYDLTIIGKKAPEIMLYIFKKFLLNVNQTTTFCFDTNLYCMGFYSPIGINMLLKKHIIKGNDDSIISFQPIEKDEKDICLKYACIKLLEADMYLNNSSNSNDVKKSTNELKNALKLIKTNNPNNPNNSNKYLIQKYYKYYEITNNLFKFLYPSSNNKSNQLRVDQTNFFEYMCKGFYYSIEAYYTPCTVNVVVLEMQAGQDLGLDPFNYLISAIENLADLNIHMKHSNVNLDKNSRSVESKQMILKVSKYIYRIYYSLSKLDLTNTTLSNKTLKIKENIISKRSRNEVLKNEDLKLINGFSNSNNIDRSIGKFNAFVLKVIDNYMKSNNLSPVYN